MGVKVSHNLAWSIFIDQYSPFVKARARSLENASNGKWTYDDAVQELHQAIWQAVVDPKFQTARGDWKSWLYQRVSWKTGQMIESLTALHRKNEVLSPMKVASDDDGDRAIAVLEPTTGDSVERQVHARDWISRAVKRINQDDIPVDYQFVVTAVLEPAEGLFEFAHNRKKKGKKKKSRAAKYEIAGHFDLVDFTGDKHAGGKFGRAIAFLEKRLGNPITGAPPTIYEHSCSSEELSEELSQELAQN